MTLGRRAVLGTAVGSAAALVGCTAARDDGAGARPSRRPSSAPPVLDVADPGGVLRARCRDDWGAAPVAAGAVRQRVRRLTVHHSAYRLPSAAGAGDQLRMLQRRQQADGFPDIAYHYLVDVSGRVFEGRDPALRGDTYTQYDPTGHLGVCMLGHYDRQPLTRAAASALVGVLAWASAEFDVDTATIRGHDELDPVTVCPGRALTAVLDDGSLRAAVDDLLARRDAPDLRVGCRGPV